jgi:hypothetical protein
VVRDPSAGSRDVGAIELLERGCNHIARLEKKTTLESRRKQPPVVEKDNQIKRKRKDTINGPCDTLCAYFQVSRLRIKLVLGSTIEVLDFTIESCIMIREHEN